MVAVGHLVNDRLYFPAVFGDDGNGFTNVKSGISFKAVEGTQMFFGNLVQCAMYVVTYRLFDIGETLERQTVVLEHCPAEWFVAWATGVHSVSVKIGAVSEVNDGFFYHDATPSFEVVGRP